MHKQDKTRPFFGLRDGSLGYNNCNFKLQARHTRAAYRGTWKVIPAIAEE
jgi:hypothetical protein